MKTSHTAIVVRTGVKGGGHKWNHAQSAVAVRSSVKAGYRWNHAQTVIVRKEPGT